MHSFLPNLQISKDVENTFATADLRKLIVLRAFNGGLLFISRLNSGNEISMVLFFSFGQFWSFSYGFESSSFM